MTWITPSSINLFEYCEVQFYLVKKLGIKPKKTNSLFQGEIVHEKLEKEIVTTGISLRDNLPLAFSGKISKVIEREVPVYSEKLQMIGKIDEVQIEEGVIRIIEDKPGRLNESHKLQAIVYGVLFREMFGDYPIEVMVRDRDSGRIKWRTKLTKTDIARAMGVIGKMREILEGKKKPKPTNNPKKCAKCGVNYACEFFRKRREMGLIRV